MQQQLLQNAETSKKATLSDKESKVVWVCQIWAIRCHWKKSYHEKDSIFDNFRAISKRRNRQYSDFCFVFLNSLHQTPSEINFMTLYHFDTGLGHTKASEFLISKAFSKIVKHYFLGYKEVTIKNIEKTKPPILRHRWESQFFGKKWWKWCPVFS